jgi:diguanylate cyclase (GGDEF)-like protein/PAS domain S-box-containing protein
MKNTYKIAASLFGVALLIAIVIILFSAFNQIKKAAEMRQHTFVVINRANDLLSSLIDAETDQRGYLLTGNKAYMREYLKIQDNISGHLKELRQITLIRDANKYLDVISPLIYEKLAEMSYIIRLRHNTDVTVIIAVVGIDHGQKLMGLIRTEMNSFIKIEQTALEQYDETFHSTMRRLFILIVAASLIILLVALSLIYLIYRETQYRLMNASKISEDEAREYAESIINTMREPLISLDKDLRVVTVSHSFCKFFKVKQEETVGQLIYDLGNRQWDIPKLRELLEDILPKKAAFDNYEVEHNFADIGRRVMLLNARQIKRSMGKERIILLAIEDITERKHSEEKIKRMVYHDSLTDLPNRKLFSDRLGVSLAQAKRDKKEVGIAMIDLDNFKGVNDTLGHDVGDLLLNATAERLSLSLRGGDTVARFGGDEFVLILPGLESIEDSIQVVHQIVESFRKPFIIEGHELIVTTSIGMAVYPNDGKDESSLLKNADIAMYQAKQAGRSRYHISKKD